MHAVAITKFWDLFYLPLQMRRRRKVRKPDLGVGRESFDLVKGHHHSIIIATIIIFNSFP